MQVQLLLGAPLLTLPPSSIIYVYGSSLIQPNGLSQPPQRSSVTPFRAKTNPNSTICTPKTPLFWVRFPKRTHRIIRALSVATNVSIGGYTENATAKRWVRFAETYMGGSFSPVKGQSCAILSRRLVRHSFSGGGSLGTSGFPISKNCTDHTPFGSSRPAKRIDLRYAGRAKGPSPSACRMSITCALNRPQTPTSLNAVSLDGPHPQQGFPNNTYVWTRFFFKPPNQS